MIKTPCPQPETLGRYVLGQMDPAEMQYLEKHLMECPSCCDQAETLNPRDEVTKAFGLPSQGDEADEEIVKNMIQRVTQLGTVASPTVSMHASNEITGIDDPGDAEMGISDILSPPVKADELGRLGDYRILKILGSGGMGFVFLAEDEKLRRRVALKVMKPTEARRHGAKERFLREARAAAAIEHDNVVTIHQVGEDRGIPFIAMPMLQGDSLRSILERESPLAQERAIAICRQAASGLAAAHETGLVHRDIKPDNLWIESTKERVKILDFGLVREVGDGEGLTLQGTVLGTPSYMSPEQASGESLDHRSDLFSLGAVFYQMLSGKSPYAAGSLTATLLNVARAQPTPIETLVPGLDRELVALVAKMNSREPKDRPQTAAEVVQTLERIESRLQSRPSNTHAASPKNSVKASSSRKPPKIPVWKYVMAGGLAAAVILSITFLVQLGKYTVQITVDDPSIALKIDGKDILIEDEKTVTRLSAGPHRLTVNREGFSTVTDEFTVERDGKNVLHVSIVEGQIKVGKDDALSASDGINTKSAIDRHSAIPKVEKSENSRSLSSNDPDRRAAEWMHSIQPQIVFRLMSRKDANRQWNFIPKEGLTIPEEPFLVYEIILTRMYTERLGNQAAEELAIHLKGIREVASLRMECSTIDELGIGKVFELPEFASLTELHCSGTTLNDQVFAQAVKLQNLMKVAFSNVPLMKGNGIGLLSACPKLHAVGWTIATPSIESMEELEKLPMLNELEINSIDCTERHMEAIGRLNLRKFALYNSGLNDALIKHLSKLTQLEYLKISDGQISDEGLMELRNLKLLRDMDVRQTQVTPAGIAAFQKEVPGCKFLTNWGEVVK